MIGVNNFIAFLTVNGFFLGICFGLLKTQKPEMMLFWVAAVTALFYMIALGSSSLFIRYITFKPRYKINKEKYEASLDSAIIEIQKREKKIKEMYEFIKELEEEEFERYKKDLAHLTKSGSR